MNTIRDINNLKVKKLGLKINPSLPLLGDNLSCRSEKEIIERFISLFVIVACSYGFSKEDAKIWLTQEKVFSALTKDELDFLSDKNKNIQSYSRQVEALWAFAWSLQLIDELDFKNYCDNSFIGLFPNLKIKESAVEFKKKLKLRDSNDIIENADLVYCIHWAYVENSKQGIKNKLDNYVVEERRRVFEWIISNQNWDDISLDT